MAKILEIEQNLRDVTNAKPKGKEKRMTYLRRLALATQDISEEDWEDLKKDSQAWANSAVKKLDKDSKAELEEPDLEEDDDVAEDEPQASAKGKTKAKAKKSAAAPKVKKAAPKAPPKENKKAPGPLVGIKVEIKKMVLKKPGVSAEEIMTALEKKGVTPSKFTVSSIRAEFRHSLKLLKQEELLDIEI